MLIIYIKGRQVSVALLHHSGFTSPSHELVFPGLPELAKGFILYFYFYVISYNNTSDKKGAANVDALSVIAA